MDRRGFLQSLMIGASALAVDPERLLWTPGKRKIFIPVASNDTIPGLPDGPTLLLTMSFDDGTVSYWKSEYVPAVTLNHSHLIAEATDFRFTIADSDELFKGYSSHSERHPTPRLIR